MTLAKGLALLLLTLAVLFRAPIPLSDASASPPTPASSTGTILAMCLARR